MPGLLALKPVAGLAWKAVRRLLGTPQAGHPQSLTIGAVVMPQDIPRIPSVPGVPSSRRSLGYEALLQLAQDLLIARFAIARCADKLTTGELLDVLDEVSELVDGLPASRRLRSVTERSDDR